MDLRTKDRGPRDPKETLIPLGPWVPGPWSSLLFPLAPRVPGPWSSDPLFIPTQLGGTGYTMVLIGIPSSVRCLDGGLENCIA